MVVAKPIIVGVGNRLRGDDAIGCLVIDQLAGFDEALTIDAGVSPEDYVDIIVRSGPERVLFVDACDFGGRPAETRFFSEADMGRMACGLLSTHTIPLHLTATLVASETKATVQLLGVQPISIGFGQPLSDELSDAIPAIIGLCRVWARGAPKRTRGCEVCSRLVS